MNENLNAKQSRSQTEKILQYLLKGNAITALEALDKFQCMRLGARIADIKERGYKVWSKFVVTTSKKRVKSYIIPGVCMTKRDISGYSE